MTEKREDPAVDVIIPSYRPDGRFFELLRRLGMQTVLPGKVIIMNTEKLLWDESGAEERLSRSGLTRVCPVEIHHISRADFDHAGTRRQALQFSDAPRFVMMTQDAVPADRRLLEQLTAALGGRVKMSYARQLPSPDADPVECCSRRFNYGPESRTRDLSDLPSLGIRTWFASNVCAAYDREVYEETGGYVPRAIFNEDMLYCCALLKAGYAVRYCAEARVFHSHSYTGLQQLKRNFDLGVSQAQHPEVFAEVPSESEGLRMIQRSAAWLRAQGKADRLPRLFWLSGCKYLGYRLGKAYRALPRWAVKKLSSNPVYWDSEG